MQGKSVRSLLAGLAVLAAAGCAGGNVVDTSVDNSLGFQPGDGAVVYLTGHRHHVGDVSGTTLTGGKLSLADLHGKVVVVNFWSTSCAPCTAEAPYFNAVAREDAARGVAFVGIDNRDSMTNGRAFEQAHHVPYPSIFDPDLTLDLQFPGAVPPSTPTTIVVDRNGDIAAKVDGALEYTQLRSLVNAVVGEKT